MPSGIGSVVRVRYGIGLVVRKLGAATLIQCRQRSFTLITHFDAWKLLDIGVQPRIRCAALSWPSLWTNILAFSILSKLGCLTRLKLGTTAFLSTKPLGKTKEHCQQKTAQIKGKLIYKHKQKKRGGGWLWNNQLRPKAPLGVPSLVE